MADSQFDGMTPEQLRKLVRPRTEMKPALAQGDRVSVTVNMTVESLREEPVRIYRPYDVFLKYREEPDSYGFQAGPEWVYPFAKARVEHIGRFIIFNNAGLGAQASAEEDVASLTLEISLDGGPAWELGPREVFGPIVAVDPSLVRVRSRTDSPIPLRIHVTAR